MAFEFEKIREVVPIFPQIQQLNLLEGIHGSVRGFHWSQLEANHWKVLTVVSGTVRDAFLDIRKSSDSFGVVGYVDLDQQSKVSIVIPPGFAHGMQTLSSNSTTVYATNIAFEKNREQSISPTGSGLGKLWLEPKILSTRDSESVKFDGETSICKVNPIAEAR